MSIPPFHTAKMPGRDVGAGSVYRREGLDYLTEIGARALADRIVEVWSLAGFRVRAWPEHCRTRSGDGFYTVRTDLIRGLPREGGE